jgi:flagellar hook-basal body complex protein FliE
MEIATLPLTPVQPVGVPGIKPVSILNTMAAQAAAPSAQANASFQELLAQAIGQTNQSMLQADDMSRKLATGEAQDMHQVMIAMEKANLSLQMTLQVRNKMVDAYQEIMRMQI